MLVGAVASVCLWIAIVAVGAAALGLLRFRVGLKERCLMLSGLRLPKWLLRPIGRWLRAQRSPVQVEAVELDALEIGWSTKGCVVVGLRGVRVVLTASCQGLDAAEGPVVGPLPAAAKPKKRQPTGQHNQGTSNLWVWVDRILFQHSDRHAQFIDPYPSPKQAVRSHPGRHGCWPAFTSPSRTCRSHWRTTCGS